MAAGNEGWQAVLSAGGWPAISLAVVTAVFRGPSLLRFLGKEYTQAEEKKRDELDKERDGISVWKDKELDRLRSDVAAKQESIDRLKVRIEQLMRALAWWREYSRDMRHDRMNDQQRHQAHERQYGVPVLLDAAVPPVPALSEESDAEQYRL